MTTLRVLSGLHAGASIAWSGTRLRLGPSETLDVYIGDWNAPELELERDQEGRHLARWTAADGDLEVAGQQREGATACCLLHPWVPVRFGAVILCIGPSDQPWPDDAQLLQRCFAPQPSAPCDPELPPRRAPRRRLLMVLAAVPCVVIAATAAMSRADGSGAAPASAAPEAPEVVVSPASAGASADAAASAAPATPAAQPDPVRQLRRLLDPAALAGLALEPAGERVVVRGVLGSRAEVDRLNQLLDQLPPTLAVSRRFVAVPEIIDRLYESIPDSGLKVAHAGQHLFRITGSVDDIDRSTQAVERIAADLAEFGLRIDTALQERNAGIPALSGMLVDSQGTSFLRTRDGVKHIVPAPAVKKPATETAR
ncbi:hypothetical protein ACPOLB_24875 [Rubrivivax sp. RP6-9]|uniref:hypothetical protein n=1 Tax=Rubrivivax sp. RP6-9 TaxID=3415750 RepID=UPI003CC63A21